ncbi:hypothetical protein M9M90_04910 [Phenylobacterium sp. LH3H17]|uniref:hypothetical protein n=1 Tax=Phenylobacterium sp. LH3H17 TaxID=2903901 RepID=UPI0020C9AB1A|nr:hypothetical protein [Phenylobacterium sp. LH3H17]UTP40527.1 hypothetical protein M9M90_04910 [Phenylobacterium sp. LH3H17]
MMPIIFSRLRRLILLLAAALTPGKVRRKRRAIRRARPGAPSAMWPSATKARPSLQRASWVGALALQPIKSRKR